MTKPFAKIIYLSLLLCIAVASVGGSAAAGERPAESLDDTHLMFVGEEVEVLSIASRREESAWNAPAVAQVVTREKLDTLGVDTVSDALATLPGFHMAEREWGTEPYLRGIADSVLFLYDTVPIGSDINKTVHPIDNELSLAPIKRIEVIRGPGSVLWGPDAFAGIVNIVPMTGKDLQGAQTGVLYETPGDHRGAYINYGHDGGRWDGFISATVRRGQEDDETFDVVRFWGAGDSPVAPDERMGHGVPDDARYLDILANLSYEDWFSLSGRISDNEVPHTVTRAGGDVSWPETRHNPGGFLKVEANKTLNLYSGLRFTGYYSRLDPKTEIIGRSVEQEESTTYAEVIYDRSLMTGRGVITGGLSYRRRTVRDAPVWDSFVPDFLSPDNTAFLPTVTLEDYDTTLRSLFGQYRHKWGDVDAWLGLRADDHDDYTDRISYNAGVSWGFRPAWMVKLLYGTAYRTPFARQLLSDENPELEKINCLSAQLAWKPSRLAEFTLTGFINRIDHHIKGDPYAGLSEPNDQRIRGLEVAGNLFVGDHLEVGANLTLLENSGPRETYRFNDYTIVQPDGSVFRHFVDITSPYDIGPKRLFNLSCTWRPTDRFTGFAHLSYTASRKRIFPKATEFPSTSSVWIADVSGTFHDLVADGLDLSIRVENLFDHDYDTPGTYTMIDGHPLTVSVMLEKRW